MPLVVTIATTPEDIAICMALRYEVFINEQGFHPDVEIDPKDALPTTRHLLGKDTDQDKYVATARCLLTPDLRKAKIGRVAVLKACRGKSFGVALMQGLEKVLAHECDTLLLSSQYDKRMFYEKCGYEYLNEEVYLEEGVEHCMMAKKIQAQTGGDKV